jgi:hypothetical protein
LRVENGRDRLILGKVENLTATNVRINGQPWTPPVSDAARK